MSEPKTGNLRVRVRWGWIITCMLLGLAGIAAGFRLVAPADRTGYLASVLAGVGTTLLLVGFVVLLERRIVDTAAKVVRRAVDAERKAADARIDRLVDDLTERVSAEWAQSGAVDVTALKRRTTELTNEMVERVVEETSGTEAAPDSQRPVGTQ